MKRISLIVGAIIVLGAITYALIPQASTDQDIYVAVAQGDFEISVTTTGELDAENSVRITGPQGMRAAQLWQVQINKIVPEGTVVEKGQFVAELDKSGLIDKLRQRENDLTKAESEFTQATLDTTLTLREARDQLVNLRFEMEQKKLELEQSAYEPPATIKQVEISLQKAQRDYDQAKENYNVKVAQAEAKVKSARASLINEQNTVGFLRDLMSKFVINAPENGMLIYHRDWDGVKKREGSTISAWNPVVATLPDLTAMVSRTYVNEVDIRKIKKGQQVRIGLDAFPDKKLTGEVTLVANVGEQKPNSDAKVFEVQVRVNETDPPLRPAMTTSNVIVASVAKSVLSIPLEAVHAQGDSITYVFKKDGIGYLKQQVAVGATNDQSAIIEQGLTTQDFVMLSMPEGGEEKTLITLEGEPAEETTAMKD